MKLNNKGFTGLEVGLLVVVGTLVVMPLISPLIPGLNTASGKQSTQQRVKTKTTSMTPYINPQTGEPIKVLNADGSTTVLMQEESSDSDEALNETVVPKAPLAERIALWFVRLGFWGLAAALAFPGLAVTAWLWISRRFKKLKEKYDQEKIDHEILTDETTTIIRAVDEAFATIPLTLAAEPLPGEVDRAALAGKIQNAMLAVLKSKYDQSTKDLVRALRDA